ncbi:MAG: cation diffusion facilitator family transporter [Bacteroidales bacterium]
MKSKKDRILQIKQCTIIGVISNAILAIMKVIAGIVGRSGAMIADGVHSVTDFITDIIVLLFIDYSARGENKEFRYGYGKFETFATLIISIFLLIVGVGIMYDSISKILFVVRGGELHAPKMIALWMAAISILVKEILYQYTRRVGQKTESMAVVANAWHHRSDALSSIASLLGISGAIFLGNAWHILDPIAAVLVSVFILIVAVKLSLPAIKELLEISLPDKINQEISTTIITTEGVQDFHRLRTRKNGSIYIIDFHIKVAPQMSVFIAHNISTEIERKLKERYPGAIINCHIEPYKPQ